MRENGVVQKIYFVSNRVKFIAIQRKCGICWCMNVLVPLETVRQRRRTKKGKFVNVVFARRRDATTSAHSKTECTAAKWLKIPNTQIIHKTGERENAEQLDNVFNSYINNMCERNRCHIACMEMEKATHGQSQNGIMQFRIGATKNSQIVYDFSTGEKWFSLLPKSVSVVWHMQKMWPLPCSPMVTYMHENFHFAKRCDFFALHLLPFPITISRN